MPKPTAKKKKSKDKGGDAKPKQADQLQQKLQDLAFRKLWDKEVATSRIKELEETIKRLEDKEHFYDTVSKQLITERERRKQNQKALEISQANEKRLSEDLKILRKERMLDQKTWEKMKTEMEDMHARDVKNREQAYQDLQEKYSKYSQFEPTEKELRSKVESLQHELKRVQEVFDARMEAAEHKAMTEKTKMKKDMVRKVKETKLSLLNMTEDQLHTTTKRTIAENEQMTTELHFQSRKIEQLIQENTELVEKLGKMRQELELHEDAEKMFATRTHFFQKLIQKLTEKVRVLENQQTRESSAYSQRDLQREKEVQELRRQVKDITRDNAQLEQLRLQAQEELESMKEELERQRAANEAIYSLQDETSAFLLACIEDVKRELALHLGQQKSVGNHSARWSVGDELPPRLLELPLSDREEVLRYLFNRLNGLPTGAEATTASGAKGSASVQEKKDEEKIVLPPI